MRDAPFRKVLGSWGGLIAWLVMALPAHATSGIGMNASGLDYYSSDMSVLDQMKRASPWRTVCDPRRHPECRDFAPGASAGDTKELDKVRLDANGWPLALPASDDPSVKFRHLSKMLLTHNGRVHPEGEYTVLYDGKGELDYQWSARRLSAKPGREVVWVGNQRDAGVLLTIKSTDPADPIRNIRFLMPGGICAQRPLRWVPDAGVCDKGGVGPFVSTETLAQRQAWNPAYVRDLRGFRAIRFLDMGRVNGNDQAEWAERPQLQHASWTGQGGVPYEAQLELAGLADADAWINLPYRASDDYARQFARLARERLKPGTRLILEYGNEPWNAIFKASAWMRERAVAKWPDEVAKGTSPFTLQPSWYGWRSAQLCRIVKSEFGAQASRVRCVVNTHAANPWNGQQVLRCPHAAAELGQPCGRLVDAMAIAPYFGNHLADPSVRPLIASWYERPDKGLSLLFEEILGRDEAGRPVNPPLLGKHARSIPGGAVALSAQWSREAKATAAEFNLPLYAYEAGQHLLTPGRDKDEHFRALIVRAQRDPRMGLAYRQLLDDWRQLGGQTYMLFNHIGRSSVHGSWGMKESQDDDAAPKWQAILPYRDEIPCWWPQCQN